MKSAKISSQRIHTGRTLNLDIDTVRFPDGSTGTLEMIRHPGASAIVPFLSDPLGSDPQLLLIKQYRYATEGEIYEIPAGRLELGEDPKDCARRELLEETGCTAESIEYLYTMYTTPGFTDERIHVFMATKLVRGEAGREADEFMSIETMALSKALRLIQTGVINDAKTALAILYAAGFKAAK